MSAAAAEGGGVSAAAGVGDTAAAFPMKRLKHVVALRRLRTSAGDATRPYVGLEDIESGTGRLVNGPRGKRGSSPPAPSVTDGDFSSLSKDSAKYPSGPPAPSVTDGDEEPGRCFRQNAGGNSPSAPSATDGNEATGTAFEPGDVLFGKLRPYLAKAWVAEFPGRCTTEALVMEPTSIEPRFLRSVCLSSRFVSDVDASTFGSKMPRAEWDFIGNMPVPVPDPDTQRVIADYLDRETARLDALVAAKERLLELLAEKRRAVVTRAVTRGLDPRAPMRDSGVPWLGEIPAHWDVWKIGHLASVGNGSTPRRDKVAYWADGTIPWLNSSVVNQAEVTRAEQFVTACAVRECHLSLVDAGSVLVGITGQGKTRGRSVVLSIEATINQNLAFIKPNRSLVKPWFLRWVLFASYAFLRSISDDGGRAEGALTCEQITQLRIPVPSLNEQILILDHVVAVVERIDALRATTERTIAIIKERRTALIAAAVTGRIAMPDGNKG